MKLHHFETNGKRAFIKSLFSSLIGDSQHSLSKRLTTPATSTSAPVTTLEPADSSQSANHQLIESNLQENKLIELFDRLGRSCLHDFTTGNICVFSDDFEVTQSFSEQLVAKLAWQDHIVQTIDAKRYSTKQQNDSNIPLLIKASGAISPKLIKEIIQASRTVCILKLKGNKITNSLSGAVKSSLNARELISGLGGNHNLRELMIASLTKDEFLLIENTPIDQQGCEFVRCFQTIIKQSDELF
jgi:hypothetical protein